MNDVHCFVETQRVSSLWSEWPHARGMEQEGFPTLWVEQNQTVLYHRSARVVRPRQHNHPIHAHPTSNPGYIGWMFHG